MVIDWLTSKSDTHFDPWYQDFLSPKETEKCDSMVKLSAESSTSGDREFDTTIKFNASTGDEFDLHVVPESL